MMLASVKCLFWTIRGPTEAKLVLAHQSFSLFTSCCVTFPRQRETDDTRTFERQRREEPVVSKNVKTDS